MVRDKKEVLSDRLLLLWLIYDAMIYKRFGDTKAQKLAYLSEKKMIDNREKGFNYDFIKLPYGPYSEDLEKDIDWLEEQKLIEAIPISDDAKVFHESHFGRKMLNDFHELFVRNNLFTRKIAEVNRTYATKNSREIVDYVHSLPHPYIKGRTIDDLKLGTKILYKLVERKAKTIFDITPEELATLDIYLDDESYRSVMQASESAKRKPLLSFDEVFWLYDAYFTDDFNKHFKKLTKKDNQLRNRLKSHIEEMKTEKPRNPGEYIADLKGKWKMKVGDYRMLYAYCEDCRAKNYERFNQCLDCKAKNDNAIVYFDVIHRSHGYDDL